MSKWPSFFICITVVSLMLFCPVSEGKGEDFSSIPMHLSQLESEADDVKSIMVELITGLSKPPFIIQEQNSGLQLDIIKAAFLTQRISPQFIHMPLGRNISGFQRWNVDGIITVPANFKAEGAYISKPYITYQNVAVSLASLGLSLNVIEDLTGKNIVAFQNAKKYLGDRYGDAIAYSLNYREVALQLEQIELLYTGKTEVIILDINIFKYFLHNHRSGKYLQPVDVHYIFKERFYSAGFKSQQIRDKFDSGIDKIKENGTYQLILDNYLK
ncbi:substrate-binding periplasmic protein [Thalassomonas haliotis]|uniref:Transporter substrate-binding domain-containing protein n=1 Tax=Thalassomonas haliotis TaxID=485448 RepID=A0ABY7V963_9GAMM|nr:transporter substrate-binding domain-containing protein [Thalassomonas haliotis]WDE10143.1 transporter substrate-binding domain-containing protein [Thalassomonas haliotis]